MIDIQICQKKCFLTYGESKKIIVKREIQICQKITFEHMANALGFGKIY